MLDLPLSCHLNCLLLVKLICRLRVLQFDYLLKALLQLAEFSRIVYRARMSKTKKSRTCVMLTFLVTWVGFLRLDLRLLQLLNIFMVNLLLLVWCTHKMPLHLFKHHCGTIIKLFLSFLDHWLFDLLLTILSLLLLQSLYNEMSLLTFLKGGTYFLTSSGAMYPGFTFTAGRHVPSARWEPPKIC